MVERATIQQFGLIFLQLELNNARICASKNIKLAKVHYIIILVHYAYCINWPKIYNN